MVQRRELRTAARARKEQSLGFAIGPVTPGAEPSHSEAEWCYIGIRIYCIFPFNVTTHGVQTARTADLFGVNPD